MKLFQNLYNYLDNFSLFLRKIFVSILKVLIYIYKLTLSPILKYLFGGGCKYKPTCSEYSVVVIEKYGIIRGGLLSFKRIISCNNFFKAKK